MNKQEVLERLLNASNDNIYEAGFSASETSFLVNEGLSILLEISKGEAHVMRWVDKDIDIPLRRNRGEINE